MTSDVRTDDEIARLFADANPVPNGRDAGGRSASGPREQTEITLGAHLPDPTSEVERGHHTARWLVAAAVTVLVVSAAALVIRQGDPADVDRSTSDPSRITTPDTLAPTRLQVAKAFVDAVSAHDAAAANRYLVPGFVPAVVPGADVGVDAPASLDDQLAWFGAFDWTWQLESCRENSDASAVCTVRQRNRLSDLAGLEFPAQLLFGFEEGRIGRLVVSPTLTEYGPQAFRPFYSWVAEQSPDDVERLWRPEVTGFLPPIISSDATELMDARLTEYVAAYGEAQAAKAANVEAAEAFIDAFNQRDTSTLDSLIADPPELARSLLGGDAAVGIAWLDAFEWRWTEPTCADGDGQVLCQVVRRDELTDATGIVVPTTLRFSITSGLVTDLSIVDDDGPYRVRALEPFVEWVAATYPEDLRTMWDLPVGSEAVSPRRTEVSVPLFESRLDEWTAGTVRPVPAHREFLDAQSMGDAEQAAGLLAPVADVDELWARSTDDLPGLATLLDGLGWRWNVRSCEVTRKEPDPVRPELACLAEPTSRLEAGGITSLPVVVELAVGHDGIASVSTGSWVERSTDRLAPLFDWIRETYPQEADELLAARDGLTVPVLAEDAVARLLELVDDYLAEFGG